MQIFLQVLLLIVGFVFLVKGSDWFVDGAAEIAEKFGIPQLIIGLTIVAMGTSAPEAAVSITAAFNGSADITIGNIVGSNILNVLIILGLSAVVFPLVVKKNSIVVDIPVTIAATVLLLVQGIDGNITRIDGIIMLISFISYLIFLFFSAKKGNTDSIEMPEDNNMSLPKAILLTIIGLALIIAGSNFVVKSASFIARAFGWSERFIGLTIVALGTSLPELFTSVSAAYKKNCDIAIGNIIGSNLFNILFVVGLSSVIIDVPFRPEFRIDTLVALASMLLLFFFCLPKNKMGMRKLTRVGGVIFLISYCLYFGLYLI